MPNIGSLTVELDLQTQQYEAGLKRSKAQIVDHANSLTVLQRTAQSTGTRMTAASDEIVAAWGKSGKAAQDAIAKMEAVGRSNAVNSGIREIRTATDDIVKGWGKVGDSAEDAGTRTDHSMREVHVTLKSIEQVLGIHIPKALERMITDSKTLGPILAGAFSGVAIASFIPLLAQVPALFEKLKESVTGWDAAAQKAYEHQIELNKEFLAISRIGRKDTLELLEQDLQKQSAVVAGLDTQIAKRKELNGVLSEYIGIVGVAIGYALDFAHVLGLGDLTKEFTTSKDEADKLSAALKRASKEAEQLNAETLKGLRENIVDQRTAAEKKAQEERQKIIEAGNRIVLANQARLLQEEEGIHAQELRNIGIISDAYEKQLDEQIKGLKDIEDHQEGNLKAQDDILRENAARMVKYLEDIQKQSSADISGLTTDYVNQLTQTSKQAEQKLKDLDQAAKESGQEAVRQYEQAFQEVRDSAGHVFDNLMQTGGGLSSVFKGFGQTMARDLFATMSANFLTPFKQALDKAIQSAVQGLGALGGALAAVGIGASVSLISGQVGKGRKEATRFVEETQDPFGEVVGDLFKSLEKARNMGTLTIEEVSRARDQLDEMWSDFQKAAAKAQYGVGQQAIEGLNPIMAKWRSWLDDLTGSAADADAAIKSLNASMEEEAKKRQAVQDILDKISMPAGDISGLESTLEALSGLNKNQLVGAVGDDIRRIGDALAAASRPIPPMIQDLYNFIKAQDAVSEAAARNTEIQQAQMQALAEEAQAFAAETQSIIDRITRPAGDTRALEAALTSVGGMDRAQIIAAIGDEIKRVGDAMTKAGQSIPPVIRDLYDFAKAQDAISEATSRILDINKELTSVYDDLGTALNRQLDKLDTEKQSLQQQIVDAENDAARSQLQDTLDTTSSLGEYIRTQASLNELDRKIKADKKKAELEDIQRMKDRLAAVTALQDVTNSALDSLGLQREHENDLMDSSITALIQRGSALEDERKMLAKVTGATEMVTSAFDALLAVFYPFMEPIALKSYQHGTDFVPSTGAYLLHKGESVTPAGERPRGGGDVTVNFNAPVIGDMDELVDRLSPALLEANRYDVQFGSQRPAIRQRAARSNRW